MQATVGIDYDWLLPLLAHPPTKQDLTILDAKRGKVTYRILFEKGPHAMNVTKQSGTVMFTLGDGKVGNVATVEEAAQQIASLLSSPSKQTNKSLWLQAGVEDETRSGDEIAAVAYGGPIVSVDFHNPGWNHFRDFHAGLNAIELINI